MSPDQEIVGVVDEILDVVGAASKLIGQCKWFNASLGYGFLTICTGSDAGKDIFVHHSGIKPCNSHYRTLWKGEYVSFALVNGPNGPQATSVTGVCGGSLMCDVAPVRRVPGPGPGPGPN
ncbi:Cold shock-like protein CspB [Tetrabaena socialis]|uniref:Cold shock-like protein CspB n=1 Tax=Tetrabaena socialis TaxID=47790 RepID=A0A2J7ZKX3_9CHLO|nr:Cold shock-like protein CspB [Tetrabaena socialis]|eukprot:PNH00913.1 Cold shock-like protein CspB [Tetrabaena socialis]